jgi:lipoprotein-anchoring transpeptidase ErfK/SrfK
LEDAVRAKKQIQMAAVMMTAVLAAQAALAADQQTAPLSALTAPTPAVKREIVVSLEDRKLALVEDGQAVKVYSVAVGKPTTPSPAGSFTIERRVANPTYHHDGKTILPGPHNPVGTRWMGLSIKGYGIHGTNEPKSIGKAASHGCIRMAKADLEELYPLVQVGDTVEIVGQRDEETARLFGDGATQAPQNQPVLAANAPAVEPPATASQGAVVATAATENAQTTKSKVEAAALAVFTGAL